MAANRLVLDAPQAILDQRMDALPAHVSLTLSHVGRTSSYPTTTRPTKPNEALHPLCNLITPISGGNNSTTATRELQTCAVDATHHHKRRCDLPFQNHTVYSVADLSRSSPHIIRDETAVAQHCVPCVTNESRDKAYLHNVHDCQASGIRHQTSDIQWNASVSVGCLPQCTFFISFPA